ncbi:MAG: hypothetical protein FJW39_25435 [Acidobacteria bacterium]|nr:hypothetical protein [Acidobacteriota bacterium]
MRCLHCKNQIGAIRALHDREYCCDEHREQARSAYSARFYRDNDYGSGLNEAIGPPKKKSGFGTGTGIALIVMATLAIMFIPGDSGDGGGKPGRQGVGYSGPQGLTNSFARMFPASRPSVSIREDFRQDLSNWQGGFSAGRAMADWQRIGPAFSIGQLRLWKPTLKMADYNVNFGAQIDTRAVGWAFRAMDHGSYYATKVSLDSHGGVNGSRGAAIVRTVMLGGNQVSKMQLPLPLPLEKGKVYEIAMRVSGGKFVTAINGQVVDSWSDHRLKRGGVGFFSEPGEKSVLHWVSVDERESFFDRFLSFSFLITPWSMPVE